MAFEKSVWQQADFSFVFYFNQSTQQVDFFYKFAHFIYNKNTGV